MALEAMLRNAESESYRIVKYGNLDKADHTKPSSSIARWW